MAMPNPELLAKAIASGLKAIGTPDTVTRDTLRGSDLPYVLTDTHLSASHPVQTADLARASFDSSATSMASVLMENGDDPQDASDAAGKYVRATAIHDPEDVEADAGISFWDRLRGVTQPKVKETGETNPRPNRAAMSLPQKQRWFEKGFGRAVATAVSDAVQDITPFLGTISLLDRPRQGLLSLLAGEDKWTTLHRLMPERYLSPEDEVKWGELQQKYPDEFKQAIPFVSGPPTPFMLHLNSMVGQIGARLAYSSASGLGPGASLAEALMPLPSPVDAAVRAANRSREEAAVGLEREKGLDTAKVMDARVGKDKMDTVYQRGGTPVQLLLTAAYTAGDFFLDPLFLLSEVGPKAVVASRGLLPVAERVSATAKIATNTGRFQDAKNALTEAENLWRATVRTHNANPTESSWDEVYAASRHVVRWRSKLEQMKDVGVATTVNLQRPPRLSPQTLRTVAPITEVGIRRTRWQEFSDMPDEVVETIRRHFYKEARNNGHDAGMANAIADEAFVTNTFEDLPPKLQRRVEVERKKLVLGDINQQIDDTRKAIDERTSLMTTMKEMGAEEGQQEVAKSLAREQARHDAWIAERRRIARGKPEGTPEHPEITLPTKVTVDGQEYVLGRRLGVNEVQKAAEAERIRAAGVELPEFYQLDESPEIPGLYDQRALIGPDDTEMTADALGRLAHGAAVDDVTIHNLPAWEYSSSMNTRPRYVTSDGMIDHRAIAKTTFGALKKLKKASRQEPIPFDETWLPTQAIQRKNPDEWLEDMRSGGLVRRVTEGLYPGSLVLRPSAGVQAALYPMREPMRVMESVDPNSYAVLRNALGSTEHELITSMEYMREVFKRCGVMKVSRKLGSEKIEIDKGANKAFAILQNIPESEWEKASVALAKEGITVTEDLKEGVRKAKTMYDEYARRYGIYDSEKYIDGYLHHFLDRAKMAAGERPTEFIGMRATGTITVPHLLERHGTKFNPDAVQAADIYLRAATKKMNMEPALRQVLQRAKDIARNDASKKWYLEYMADLVNEVRGRPSSLGRSVDRYAQNIVENFGKRYDPGSLERTLMGVTGLAYMSALGGNMRYPVMSLTTNIVTTASRYGMFRTLKGAAAMATPEGQLLARQMGADKQWRRILEAPVWESFTTFLSKLPPSVAQTEYYIRGLTFHAAVGEILKTHGFETLTQATEAGMSKRILAEAVRSTEEVNHMFGVLGRSPTASQKVGRGTVIAGMQFLSFAPKQTEQIIAQTRENPGALLQYLMLSGWMARSAATEAGMNLSSYVGFGYAPKGLNELSTVTVDAIGAGFKFLDAVSQQTFRDGDPKDTERAGADWLRSLSSYVPLITATKQMGRRIDAATSGEVRSPDGQLKRGLSLGDYSPEKGNVLQAFADNDGQPSEALSIMLGMQSVKDTQFQQANMQVSRIRKEQLYELEKLADEVVAASEDHDQPRLRAAVERMHSQFRGMPVGKLPSMIESREEALLLKHWVRQMQRDEWLIPEVYKTLEKFDQLEGASQ